MRWLAALLVLAGAAYWFFDVETGSTRVTRRPETESNRPAEQPSRDDVAPVSAPATATVRVEEPDGSASAGARVVAVSRDGTSENRVANAEGIATVPSSWLDGTWRAQAESADGTRGSIVVELSPDQNTMTLDVPMWVVRGHVTGVLPADRTSIVLKARCPWWPEGRDRERRVPVLEDGSFTVSAFQWCGLLASAPGYGPASTWVDPDEQNVELNLTPGAVNIALLVRGSDGTPVGAGVSIHYERGGVSTTGVTDRDGVVMLAGVPASGAVVATFRKPIGPTTDYDMESWRVTKKFSPPHPNRLELRLTEPPIVSFRIVDLDRNPVRNFPIVGSSGGFPVGVWTGSDGTVSLIGPKKKFTLIWLSAVRDHTLWTGSVESSFVQPIQLPDVWTTARLQVTSSLGTKKFDVAARVAILGEGLRPRVARMIGFVTSQQFVDGRLERGVPRTWLERPEGRRWVVTWCRSKKQDADLARTSSIVPPPDLGELVVRSRVGPIRGISFKGENDRRFSLDLDDDSGRGRSHTHWVGVLAGTYRWSVDESIRGPVEGTVTVRAGKVNELAVR